MNQRLIRVATGKEPADCILKNARVFNVFTGEIIETDVAIADGRIAALGNYSDAAEVVDLAGRYLVPGFINSHCHVESSMVTPPAYCAEELRHGVTTLITDPHEVANVAGIAGIRFMLESTQSLPINYYVQLPSCVPATPFEHAGAVLSASDLAPLLEESRVLGLGEMMDYPGVVTCKTDKMEKLAMAQGRVVDGHAPRLTGRELCAYVAAGICNDHESTTFAEALEKMRLGQAILVREGSASRNLEAILSGFIQRGISPRFAAFCSDDKHLADLRREGSIRHCLRKAISLGLPVVDAYRMATINAAQIFRLYDLGAVAPGYRADLVVLDNLEEVSVQAVYKDGVPVDPRQVAANTGTGSFPKSVNLAPVQQKDLALPSLDPFPVVEVLGGQIVTRKLLLSQEETLRQLEQGQLCKLAVLERHHATGNVGVGLLAGYGLRDGAVATTVGHDSHNLIVVGTNDEDMLVAIRELERIQGGVALVQKGKVTASLRLPAYGLMTDLPAEEFLPQLEKMLEQLCQAGIPHDIDPLVTLSFLALPVLPEIRVTDMGIFHVSTFTFLGDKE